MFWEIDKILNPKINEIRLVTNIMLTKNLLNKDLLQISLNKNRIDAIKNGFQCEK